MSGEFDQKSIDYLVAAGVTAIQEMIASLQAENKALREENEKLRRGSPALLVFKFSEKLIRLRLAKGMTQRDLAELAGTSCPMISKYETGQCRPRLKNIIALENALDCPGAFQGASHD